MKDHDFYILGQLYEPFLISLHHREREESHLGPLGGDIMILRANKNACMGAMYESMSIWLLY